MLRLLLVVVCSALLSAAEGVWVPIAGDIGGFDGTVSAFLPWRDKLLVCGRFETVGDASIRGVALWDGSTWSEIPGAAEHHWGTFTHAVALGDDAILVRENRYDPEVERVWRWDGEHWQALPGCPDGGVVYGIVACGGDLYIKIGNLVLRWNGTVWSELPIRGTAYGIASDGTSVFVSGSLLAPGDSAYTAVVRWDGTEVHAIAGGPSGIHMPLACDPATGLLWSVDERGLWSWDGSAWELHAQPLYYPQRLVCQGGRVHVSGQLRWMPTGWVSVISYDPVTTQWSDLATTQGILGLEGGLGAWDEQLWISGWFSAVDGVPAGHVAFHDDDGWKSPTPSGTSGEVTGCVRRDGQLYVSGPFSSVSGVLANHLARWDGTAWHGLDADTDALSMHMASDDRDRLWFQANGLRGIEGIAMQGAGYLDATGWHAAGYLGGQVDALCRDGNTVVACGAVEVAEGGEQVMAVRWDGDAWRQLGPPTAYGGASAAVRTRSGALIVVGNFVMPDGVHTAARWTGTQWVQFGAGLSASEAGNPVEIAELPDGRLMVIGRIVLNGEERTCVFWDGESWRAGPPVHDPVRILQWHGRVFVLRGGGPTIYELVEGDWIQRAYGDGSPSARDAVIGDDRIFMVGEIHRMDGRACAGVVALDLLPSPAPEISVVADPIEGGVHIVIPDGTYDLRPVDGEWSAVEDTTAIELAAAAAPTRPASARTGARARIAAAAPSGGWELQRLDGRTDFSSKLLIKPDGTVVAQPTGFETTGTAAHKPEAEAAAGSGCGTGGLAVHGILGLVGLLAVRGRRRSQCD
ncbi:MAG: hypothetical protein J0M02_12675 [Planctomycetes bacterium]|nr:hypothetical protein [Planctomycetota bacterium]